MPPGVPRSRSLTLFTILVGLLHLGQSVDFVVSIIFLRSPVFAIFAMFLWFSFVSLSGAHARAVLKRLRQRGSQLTSGPYKQPAESIRSLSPVYMKTDLAL